jgi:hypothetical protein
MNAITRTMANEEEQQRAGSMGSENDRCAEAKAAGSTKPSDQAAAFVGERCASSALGRHTRMRKSYLESYLSENETAKFATRIM